MSSPPDTVDEVYYAPPWTDPAIKYGLGGGSGSVPGAKITLTRWLSAKVQDFPEVGYCALISCL